MPRTKLGIWSIGLIVLMFALIFLGMTFTDSLYMDVSAGRTILADIGQRPALALSILIGFGAGIAAFVTGVIALAKKQERHVLVFLSTLVGLGMILFLIAEVAWPH